MEVERLLTVGRLEQQQQSQRLHHGAHLSPSPSVQPSYSLAEPPDLRYQRPPPIVAGKNVAFRRCRTDSDSDRLTHQRDKLDCTFKTKQNQRASYIRVCINGSHGSTRISLFRIKITELKYIHINKIQNPALFKQFR